jgi:hypothetical protein
VVSVSKAEYIPYRRSQRLALGGETVTVEREEGSCTLQWPSRCELSEALDLMAPIAESADKVWLVTIDRSGTAASTATRGPEAAAELASLTRQAEVISRVDVDCDVHQIGQIVLSYDREVPSVGASRGVVSLTVGVGHFSHPCLQAFFSGSAPESLAGSYEAIYAKAESLETNTALI